MAIEWVRAKPFVSWIIVGALVYSGLALLAYLVKGVLQFGLAAAGGILPVFLIFASLFILAAFFTLKGKRWAYILSAAVAIVFLLLSSRQIAGSLSNPADSAFWLSFSLVPTLVLATGFSILSFRSAKTGLLQNRHLATPHSSSGLLTLAVIGFVVGGLVVGAGVRPPITPVNPDIEIVPGALTAAIPYNPQTFYTTVGGTVTWRNADSMTHTVTSNLTGLFDSGILAVGATWSLTFNTPGTYYYHCTPHPLMWGVIIVQ